METLPPLRAVLDPRRFQTFPVYEKLNSASRALAELKGAALRIPHPPILINALTMQEAKDSSAIENIVTTHDEIFQGDALPEETANASAKEVLHYRQALRIGFDLVQQRGLLITNHIQVIQAALKASNAGFRKLPGTTLRDGAGRVVYTPPQDHAAILNLMEDLQIVINDPEAFPTDPLIKMAVIHHQFESIHPFYDGNGRTGRIINVLFLIKEGLLDLPVLYLSRYLVENKGEYYRLLQAVRTEDAWEAWILYMLEAVERTSVQTLQAIDAIGKALMDYKHRIRQSYKFYSQDLINNLFTHPYTKIDFLRRDLNLHRQTAAKYLDTLAADGFLAKVSRGSTNYYINTALASILTRVEEDAPPR